MRKILCLMIFIGTAVNLGALPQRPNRHFGFFGAGVGHGGFFGHGARHGPRHFGSFFSTNRFGPNRGLFLRSRQGLADPGPGQFWGQTGPWYGWSSGFPYRSQAATGGFVESWKDRSPAVPALEGFVAPSNSLLLQEGMSEEAVVRSVGMPLERMVVAGSQIWKYSSFSLLFEAGRLKGVQ